MQCQLQCVEDLFETRQYQLEEKKQERKKKVSNFYLKYFNVISMIQNIRKYDHQEGFVSKGECYKSNNWSLFSRTHAGMLQLTLPGCYLATEGTL